jgi:hypothetical protein
VSVPSRVRAMPFSWMIRASTGNAVIDIAAPEIERTGAEADRVGEQRRPVPQR